MTRALLIVDIQNDYFPGGAMELVGSDEAAAQTVRLLQAFRKKSLRVIHIQHIALEPGATFFLPNSQGVQIHESVAPADGEAHFQKHLPNSFLNTPLLEYLRKHEISDLVIAGMMTHMCIDSTTRAAADLGFDVLLAHDACATKSLILGDITVSAANVQTSFLAALDGTFAEVVTTDEVLATL